MNPQDAADVHKDQICSMMLHQESKMLVTASNDMTIAFHQLGSAEALIEKTIMTLAISGAKLNDIVGSSPARIYTAGVDGQICQYLILE